MVRHDFYQATQQVSTWEWSDRPWLYLHSEHKTLMEQYPGSYRKKFTPDAQEWIDHNFTEYAFNPISGLLKFASEDEKMLFILTWGGE